MARSARQEVLEKCYVIDNICKDKVFQSLDELIHLSNITSDHIEKTSGIVNIICADRKIKNPSYLGFLTLSMNDFVSIKEGIDEIDESISFPDLKHLETDYNEVFDKIKWGMHNNYPCIDENSVILPELFNFKVDPGNLYYAYYVENKLFSPEEIEDMSIFRNCKDMGLYNEIVSELQKLSYQRYRKALKLNNEFNSFIVYKSSEENPDLNYESILNESLDLIKKDNEFLDNGIFEYFDMDSDRDDTDRRARR